MNVYPLIKLLAADEFKSGTELGEALQVSRTAIWKQIKQLEKLGLPLITHKQLGYKLKKPLDLLNKNLINEYLIKNSSQLKLSCLTSVDSTSDEVKRLLADSSRDKALVTAEIQTAGKGRRGKNWASPFAQNLALSLGCKLDVDLAKLQGLSLAIAVEINNCLEELGEIHLGFKWPNDIYLNNKKLAGILVEVSGDFSGPFTLIIGVGLNLFNSTGYAQIDQPYAYLEEVLPQINRNLLVANLSIRLERMLDKFLVSGFSCWQEAWNAKHLWAGKKAIIIHSPTNKQTVILDKVNDLGELVVTNSLGNKELINSGEVSLRLDNDN